MYSYIDCGGTGQSERLALRSEMWQGATNDLGGRSGSRTSGTRWPGWRVLELLEQQRAVTIVEMEAKLSDRTYDPMVCPDPINPHHLTTARHALLEEGEIEPFAAVAKGKDERGERHQITTWSLPRSRGRKTAIDKAAERRRALMSRWLSWGRRNLLGEAGESALAAALEAAPALTYVTGSTTSVLGVSVDEVDNTAVTRRCAGAGASSPTHSWVEGPSPSKRSHR